MQWCKIIKLNKSNLETNFQKTENTFLQNKNADFIIDLNVNNMQNKKSLDKNKTYKQFWRTTKTLNGNYDELGLIFTTSIPNFISFSSLLFMLSVIITSRPIRMKLHMHLSLFLCHFIIFWLILFGQWMPLLRKGKKKKELEWFVDKIYLPGSSDLSRFRFFFFKPNL